MFDPNTYRSACDRLAPDAEKLEEWITMTENKSKKYLSRPVKALLIAAACLTLLCATALAAPAIQEFFTTYTITFKDGRSFQVDVAGPASSTDGDVVYSIATPDSIEDLDLDEDLNVFVVTEGEDGEVHVDAVAPDAITLPGK